MISWSNWRLSCNTVGSVTTEGRHVVSSSSSLSLSLWVPGGNNELLRPNCPPSCTAARTKSKEPLHTGSLFGRALELGRQLASGNHEQLYIVHTKRWMRKQTWLGQRWNREHIKWSIPNQCDNCFNFFHMGTWEGGGKCQPTSLIQTPEGCVAKIFQRGKNSNSAAASLKHAPALWLCANMLQTLRTTSQERLLYVALL